MARRIYCANCPQRRELDAEDRQMGWRQRRQYGRARCPPGHGFTITRNGESEFEALTSLRCDYCDDLIPDSSPILAVTEYRGEIPGPWEPGYMELIDEAEYIRIVMRLRAVGERLHHDPPISDEDIPF